MHLTCAAAAAARKLRHLVVVNCHDELHMAQACSIKINPLKIIYVLLATVRLFAQKNFRIPIVTCLIYIFQLSIQNWLLAFILYCTILRFEHLMTVKGWQVYSAKWTCLKEGSARLFNLHVLSGKPVAKQLQTNFGHSQKLRMPHTNCSLYRLKSFLNV